MMNEQDLRVTSCTTNKPNETFAFGPIMRKEYVLQYVVSGQGYFETGGKQYKLRAGDTLLIFPNQIVHYYPDPSNPWVYLWVDFMGSNVDDLLSMTNFHQCPVCPDFEDVTELYCSFSLTASLSHEQLKNVGLLYQLLAYYIKVYPNATSKSTSNYLHIAKKYIVSNSHRHTFNVTELAQSVGIERSYLYRLFMEKEGMSPTKYIIDFRLEQSIQMMKKGVTQIKLIAHSVGYDNPLYFSNSFKKKYGMSPKNYIKEMPKSGTLSMTKP